MHTAAAGAADNDDLPADYDDDAIAQYAAEQELLEGLTAEDIFTYSDFDEVAHMETGDEPQSYSEGKSKARALDFMDEDDDVEMGT